MAEKKKKKKSHVSFCRRLQHTYTYTIVVYDMIIQSKRYLYIM
jgi:hypothetical protein